MATIRQIITDAYREGGLIQIGTTPDADQLDEGFRKLQSIIRSLIGNELGNPVVPISYGDNGFTNSYAKEQDQTAEIDTYFVPTNTRLMANISGAKTVYLDPNPRDGARLAINDVSGNFATNNLTVNANGRKIEGDDEVVLATNGSVQEWFYREDLGEWVKVELLTLNSENPFPFQFDDFLIIMLAMRLNPRYQTTAAPETVAEFRRLKKQFQAKYRNGTEMRTEEGILRLPSSRLSMFEDLPASDRKFDRGFLF